MAETADLELFNDIVNKRLIVGPTATGWDATLFKFDAAKVYQSEQIPIRWFPIKPSGPNTFVYIPVDGLLLDIAIGERAGAEAILARQNVWVPNIVEGYLAATLDLNTTDMNTALTSADTLTKYLEIKLGGRRVYQEQITIQSIVIGPGAASSLPSAAVSYPTFAEMRAECVRWFNNPPGAAIELGSDDGTKLIQVGVNNDGSLKGASNL